jgi:hypothetical protein
MKAMATYVDMLIAMPIAVICISVFIYSMQSFQNDAHATLNHGSEIYSLYSLSQEIASTISYSNLNYSSSKELASALAMPNHNVSFRFGMEDNCGTSEICRFIEIRNKTYTMVVSDENPN